MEALGREFYVPGKYNSKAEFVLKKTTQYALQICLSLIFLTFERSTCGGCSNL